MIFRALVASIFVHLAFVIYFQSLPSSTKPMKTKPSTQVEVLYLKPGQVVHNLDAPNLDLLNPSKTSYKSKNYQRVEEQQMARQSGLSQNRSQETSKKDLNPQISAQEKNLSDLLKQSRTLTKNDHLVQKYKDEQIYDLLFKEKGLSSIQDRIFRDIKYGSFTALNTNKYQFYSFYERINEQIRIRWVENIERHLDQLRMSNSGMLQSKKEWITQLVVVLNAKGDIISSYFEKSSGYPQWDESAMRSFRDSAPFVNPPREMADENGSIRLSYLFSFRIQ